MHTKQSLHDDVANWTYFATYLVAYVRLELAKEPADEIYPEIAFYIASDLACAAAYYQEFRRQGLEKSAQELAEIVQIQPVEPMFSGVVSESEPVLPIAHNRDWVEVLLEGGRAWIERTTGRWREVWLEMPALTNRAAAPTLAGLMEVEMSGRPNRAGVRHLAPQHANFELRLVVAPDTPPNPANLCRLEIAVTLHDRFGDFSGVGVTLLWGEASHQQITDTLGKASFAGLPIDQISAMRLLVTLPD